MIRKKKMTKDHDIIELKKLSGRQLDEFCTYWNSGPVHDGRKQKTKGRRAFTGSICCRTDGLFIAISMMIF